MAYGAVGPKAINIGALEPASGTAGIILSAVGTVDGTQLVVAGQCYRIAAITGGLRIGLNAVVGTTGTVNATAQVCAVPAGQWMDFMIPNGFTILHFTGVGGTAEGSMVPHAQSQ